MIKKAAMAMACFIVLFCCKASAQDKISAENMAVLHAMEDSMLLTTDSMYNAFVPDTHTFYCQQFVKQLLRALKMPNSYYYPFDKLKEKINIIGPDDNTFRIFNWSVMPTPVATRYYGAIQLPEEQLKLYPLIDYSTELGKNAEDSVLTGSKWFGALYYRIIPHEVEGRKVYTLFGLNAGSPISNKKVMDPLVFTDNGVVFGAPIFNIPASEVHSLHLYRFILEYKKSVGVSLNWDPELQTVYFDKLVSQTNDPNRRYTYVPSGEYDGFRWVNDSWNYVRDLIPVQNLKDGDAPSSGTETPGKF